MNKHTDRIAKIIANWSVANASTVVNMEVKTSHLPFAPAKGPRPVGSVFRVTLESDNHDHPHVQRMHLAYRPRSPLTHGGWVCIRNEIAVRQRLVSVQEDDFRCLFQAPGDTSHVSNSWRKLPRHLSEVMLTQTAHD